MKQDSSVGRCSLNDRLNRNVLKIGDPLAGNANILGLVHFVLHRSLYKRRREKRKRVGRGWGGGKWSRSLAWRWEH